MMTATAALTAVLTAVLTAEARTTPAMTVPTKRRLFFFFFKKQVPPTKLAASQAYVAFKQRLLLNLT